MITDRKIFSLDKCIKKLKYRQEIMPEKEIAEIIESLEFYLSSNFLIPPPIPLFFEQIGENVKTTDWGKDKYWGKLTVDIAKNKLQVILKLAEEHNDKLAHKEEDYLLSLFSHSCAMNQYYSVVEIQRVAWVVNKTKDIGFIRIHA